MLSDLEKCCNHSSAWALQKQIKKRRIRLKNAYFKEIADNINTVAEATDVEKEFAMAKKYSVFSTELKNCISNEKL